jgi:hypothetical protein
MWIFDSYFKGCVELWGREKGLTKVSTAYPPLFHRWHLPGLQDLRQQERGGEERDVNLISRADLMPNRTLERERKVAA